MSRPQLALLNAAHDGEHSRRDFRRELDANLVEFDVVAGDLPPHTDFDGVVITGSRSSVYDDEEWIDRTSAWVREAIDAGLPCLGVCWGHQLLAEVLGGAVEPMGEYELGYRSIERVGESPLLAGIDRAFLAFESHSDEVRSLPADATVIAENDCSIQGFQHGRVYGVQFHPEYDRRTARHVTEGKEGEVSDERIESVLSEITEERYAEACETKALFGNFLAIVDECQQSAAAD